MVGNEDLRNKDKNDYRSKKSRSISNKKYKKKSDRPSKRSKSYSRNSTRSTSRDSSRKSSSEVKKINKYGNKSCIRRSRSMSLKKRRRSISKIDKSSNYSQKRLLDDNKYANKSNSTKNKLKINRKQCSRSKSSNSNKRNSITKYKSLKNSENKLLTKDFRSISRSNSPFYRKMSTKNLSNEKKPYKCDKETMKKYSSKKESKSSSRSLSPINHKITLKSKESHKTRDIKKKRILSTSPRTLKRASSTGTSFIRKHSRSTSKSLSKSNTKRFENKNKDSKCISNLYKNKSISKTLNNNNSKRLKRSDSSNKKWKLLKRKSRSSSGSKSSTDSSNSSNSRNRSRHRKRSQNSSRNRRSRSYSRYASRNKTRSHHKTYRRSTSVRSFQRGRRGVVERIHPEPNQCLGVFGLSKRTTEKDLYKIFDEYGYIEKLHMITDRYTNESRGYCFITYDKVNSATKAREDINGKNIDGKLVRIDYSITKKAHTPTPGIYKGRSSQRHGFKRSNSRKSNVSRSRSYRRRSNSQASGSNRRKYR